MSMTYISLQIIFPYTILARVLMQLNKYIDKQDKRGKKK